MWFTSASTNFHTHVEAFGNLLVRVTLGSQLQRAEVCGGGPGRQIYGPGHGRWGVPQEGAE
jgi:hypothetical protein